MDYVELHCHSFYSLLDGTSSPADLVSRAADLGMDALALTDHDAVYGAVPFVTAARARGIRPILGAELTLESGHHLTLLVEHDAGWRNLCYADQPRAHARAERPGQAGLGRSGRAYRRADLPLGLPAGADRERAAGWDRAGAFRAR